MARLEKIDYVKSSRKEQNRVSYFGSPKFGSTVDPGKTPWRRGHGRKDMSRSGVHPVPQVAHKDAIYAMRTAFLFSPPEVQTDELMAEYRKLKNLTKRMRRSLRA